MADKLAKTAKTAKTKPRRQAQGQRKHVRRVKAAARKLGALPAS